MSVNFFLLLYIIEILTQLQKQATDIHNIKSELTQYSTKNDLLALEQVLNHRIISLENRIEQLENDTHIDIPIDILENTLHNTDINNENTVGSSTASRPISRVPISRYITSHHNHIRTIHQQLDLTATKHELHKLQHDYQHAIHHAMNKVADERAAKDTVNELSNVTEAIQGQITALQGILVTKVDRSEMIGLKSVAAELSTYQQFKNAATTDIRELSTKTDDHRVAINRSNDTIARLSDVLQEVATKLTSKADRSHVDRTDTEVLRLQTSIESKASMEEVRNLEANLLGTKQRMDNFDITIQDTSRIINEDRKTTDNRFNTVSNSIRTDLTTAVNNLRADIANIREEVEARAYVTSLEATDENVTTLQNTSDVLAKKIEVALRFVDWYADRGEAYEYNAGALEKHMNALAIGNRAKVTDTISDMRAKVFGATLDPNVRAAYAPLSSLVPSTTGKVATNPTGTAGTRIGGVQE